jgi:transposase
MAGRHKILIPVDDATAAELREALQELETNLKDAQAERATTADAAAWAKGQERLIIQKLKILAIQHATTGSSSHSEIAKKLGCSRKSVQCWLQRFRVAGANVVAIKTILKNWRRRKSPLRKLKILVPFLKARGTGEVTNGKTAADWLNCHYGKEIGTHLTSRKGLYWLDHLPRRTDLGHLTDEELQESLLGIDLNLFPPWFKEG